MGLAASQARLLFITSRQNDVSAQMQRISNQNMILARDEDEVSTTYNKMLAATTLQAVSGVDLSYDALMGAAGAANGLTTANVLLNSAGKVALSASDIAKYGLAETGNAGDITARYPDAKSFVKAVTGSDEIAAAADSSDKPAAAGSTLTESDITRLKQFTSTYGEYPKTEKLVSIKDMLNSMGSISAQDIKNNGGDEWLGNNIVKFGSSMSQIWSGNNSNTEIASDGDKSGVPGAQAQRNVKAIATTFMNKLLSYFGLKSGSGIATELQTYVDKMSQDAYNWNMGNGTERRNFQGQDNTLSEVARVWETSTHGSADNDHMAVNLTKMLRRMTDMVIQALGGGEGNKIDVKGTETNDSLMTLKVNSKGYGETQYQEKLKSFIGTDKYDAAVNYLSPASSKSSTEAKTATNESQASYYTSIYNALKDKGWVTDTLVTDKSKLTEALKNGTYYIYSNGTTSNAKNSGLFEEVSDSDAKSKAEHYYEDEMRKINRKEKQLDNNLTKLQTEYSALTNDYESVKSIISANVQKSFTYCQNG